MVGCDIILSIRWRCVSAWRGKWEITIATSSWCSRRWRLAWREWPRSWVRIDQQDSNRMTTIGLKLCLSSKNGAWRSKIFKRGADTLPAGHAQSKLWTLVMMNRPRRVSRKWTVPARIRPSCWSSLDGERGNVKRQRYRARPQADHVDAMADRIMKWCLLSRSRAPLRFKQTTPSIAEYGVRWALARNVSILSPCEAFSDQCMSILFLDCLLVLLFRLSLLRSDWLMLDIFVKDYCFLAKLQLGVLYYRFVEWRKRYSARYSYIWFSFCNLLCPNWSDDVCKFVVKVILRAWRCFVMLWLLTTCMLLCEALQILYNYCCHRVVP